MTDTPTRRIGLPWYRREDYPRIRDMMSDRHNLAPTGPAMRLEEFDDRVPIEPEAFARWCAKRGVEPGSAARMEYVSEKSAGNDA